MVKVITGKMYYGDSTYDSERHDYVLKSDYDALAAELSAHKRLNADLEASDVRLCARILNLRTALLAVRPAYLEYCDNADIIDAALAADSQSSGGSEHGT